MELLYEFLFKSSCRPKAVLNFLVHSSYFETSRHVVACSLLYDKTFTSVTYKCSYCFRIRKQEEQGRQFYTAQHTLYCALTIQTCQYNFAT